MSFRARAILYRFPIVESECRLEPQNTLRLPRLFWREFPKLRCILLFAARMSFTAAAQHESTGAKGAPLQEKQHDWRFAFA